MTQGKPVDPDFRFGQFAVRMGMIAAQDLPKLLKEAASSRDGKTGRRLPLGQHLVRRKLLTVSEYLYVQREVEKSRSAPGDSSAHLEKLDEMLARFEEGGGVDSQAIEAALSSEDVKLPMPSREEAPPRFGRYSLLGEVARGGMGIVYRAKDEQTDQIVALKVMIEADDDEARLARFKAESELARALDHPGIVKVHDAGAIDGMPYFTMDLVDGKSFDDLLDEGMDRFRAIEILAQVARAVDHAHERGIVHRDLKPGNVLVDSKTGQARVTDFGLARDMDRNTRITRVGQAVGTPYYMAPEQVRGERDVDGRSDTYAIGVMLYEVLTGDVPFDADSALSLFKKIDREPVNLPLDPERGIDAKIRAIALRALEKKRDDRYATSKLLAEDLERYLKGAAPKARVHATKDELRLALERHKGTIAIAGLGAAAVVLVVAGAVAVVRSVLATREEERAFAYVKGYLERARAALGEGEADLPSRAPQAEERARAAVELLGEGEKLAQGDGAQARGARRALVEGMGGPQTARAWGLLGRALRELGRDKDAEEALVRAARVEGATPDPKLHLAIARLRRKRGDLAGALAALDAALKADNGDARILIERGEAKLEAGRFEEAVQDLSLAIKDRMDRGGERDAEPALLARPYLLRARAFLGLAQAGRDRANALRSAAESASDAVARAPALAEPHLVLGDIAREREAPDAALQAYDTAHAREESSAEPLLRKGDLLLAYAAFGPAARVYDQAVASQPGRFEALHGRGRARAHRFDLAGARRDLERAARAAQETPLAADEPRAERDRSRAAVLVDLAEVARAMGDEPLARASLAEAVPLDASSAEARVALARLELEGARPDPVAAERLLEEARSLVGREGTSTAEVLEALARAKLARDDASGARADADVALVKLGARANARTRRTSLLVRVAQLRGERATGSALAGATSASDAAWDDAFSSGAEARESDARLDLATTLLRQGAARAALVAAVGTRARTLAPLAGVAEGQLAAAVRVDPLRAPAWLALAELRLARGRSDLAREAAERCVALDPYRARGHEVVALALLEEATASGADGAVPDRTGLLGKALAAAQRAVALGETGPRLALRGRVALASGDRTGALADLESAATLAPFDVEIAALAAAARDGTAESTVRSARRDELARLVEIARADDARTADVAMRARDLGTADEPLVRAALLLSARTSRSARERLAIVAQALTTADPASVDEVDHLLAPAWGDEAARPDGAELAALAKRVEGGDARAAVALAIFVLEDALRRPRGDLRAQLVTAREAWRVAPGCAVTWVAYALLAQRTGDAPLALELADVLRAAGGGDAPELLASIEAEAATAEGDRDRARVAGERARALRRGR